MAKKCIPGVVCIENVTLIVIILFLILVFYILYSINLIKMGARFSDEQKINVKHFEKTTTATPILLPVSSKQDIFNDKCVRSSVGGHFFIKNLTYLSYENINNFLSSSKLSTLCADLEGEEINSINSLQNWALILGSESHGVSNKLNFDKKIAIVKKGEIESLNVSIATGIILNELINKKN